MAPLVKESGAKWRQSRIEQGDQESVGQGGKEQEFLAALPGPDTGTLPGQFTLAIAPHHLQLPSTRIAEDDAPQVVGGRNRLRGQQVPGAVPPAATGDDQDEGVTPHQDMRCFCLKEPAEVIG